MQKTSFLKLFQRLGKIYSKKIENDVKMKVQKNLASSEAGGVPYRQKRNSRAGNHFIFIDSPVFSLDHFCL
jgi:hypothetical protein